MGYIYIALLTLFTLCLIFGLDKGKYKGLLITGFLLRILILLIDLNHWMLLPHAGVDAETFNIIATYNITHTYSTLSLTNYTWVLTFFYYISDCSRAFAQFFNVVLGIGTLLVIRRFLTYINISSKAKQYIMVLATLSPTPIILSGLLIREVWVQFFIALSMLYFFHWFTQGKAKHVIYCLSAILGAAVMHQGMIALGLGFSIAFICYRPKYGHVKLSGTAIFGILLMLAFVVFFINNMDIMGDKAGRLKNGDTDEALMASYNPLGGGSSYLTWLPIDNAKMALLFSPLKMFYFMYSPIPMDWRGLNDIISFVIDSCMYIYLTWMIWRTKLKNSVLSHFKKFMAITLLITIFIFGLGSSNAGQAMRHRAKILPAMIMTLAVCLSERKQDQTFTLTGSRIS